MAIPSNHERDWADVNRNEGVLVLVLAVMALLAWSPFIVVWLR